MSDPTSRHHDSARARPARDPCRRLIRSAATPYRDPVVPRRPARRVAGARSATAALSGSAAEDVRHPVCATATLAFQRGSLMDRAAAQRSISIPAIRSHPRSFCPSCAPCAATSKGYADELFAHDQDTTADLRRMTRGQSCADRRGIPRCDFCAGWADCALPRASLWR